MIALVVDDSLALRHIHRKALEQASWEVRTAGNGQEALDQLEAMTTCDMVLTDWHMPVMDGIELVRRIRKHARYASVPVLMITSEATIDAIDVAMSAGANDVLMKPYSAEALAERVDEVANE
jgi:two-component system chemotaxis response regulator CheY